MKPLLRPSRWMPLVMGGAILLSSFAYALPRGQAYYRLSAQLIATCGDQEKSISEEIERCKKDAAFGDYNMTTTDQGCRAVECKKRVAECRPFNAGEAERGCKAAGQGFEMYEDGNCRYGRCIAPAEPAPTVQPSTEHSAVVCPTEEQLEARVRQCKTEGMMHIKYQEDGCTFIGCRPLTTPKPGNASCPSTEQLEERIRQCEAKGNSLEKFQEGACTYVKCREKESIPPSRKEDRCAQLMSFIEKFGAEMPEEASKAKTEYTNHCVAKTPTDRGEPAPEPFKQEESACKEVREHMVRYKNAGFADTAEFKALAEKFQERCEKDRSLPPAGFEEEVLVDYSAFHNPFPDTDIQSEAGQAFAELYRRAVIGGFPDGEAKADRPVNRAEMAKFSLLACNRKIGNESSAAFRDVQPKQWYTKYVAAAAEQGIINGNPDGSFRPANEVQRDEFLKMLARACSLPEQPGASSFNDVGADNWVEPFAWIADAYDLFDAPNGMMNPGTTMTRQDVAVALYRFLKAR